MSSMDNTTKPTDLGLNRTGIGTAPVESKKTIEGAAEGMPARADGGARLESVRVAFSSVVAPVGTMPPPATLKGMAKAGLEAIKGNRPTVFMDLLGDRLAFERTGVRLYEALGAKLAAADKHVTTPTRGDIDQIRDEELQHVAMLTAALESLGADPTVLTPTADICAVASSGLMKVLTDPRSTFTHALHAIHIAEATDTEAWVMLSDLAEELDHEEMAASFRVAVIDEQRHLDLVREWLMSSLEGQAGLEPSIAGETGVPAP